MKEMDRLANAMQPFIDVLRKVTDNLVQAFPPNFLRQLDSKHNTRRRYKRMVARMQGDDPYRIK
jgi:hypothetical protein